MCPVCSWALRRPAGLISPPPEPRSSFGLDIACLRRSQAAKGGTTMQAESSFFGLTGKKALIIGGGQGMGESSALFLARAGCDLALVDLVPERADAVGQKIADLRRQSVTITGNVLDDAQIPRIVAEAEAKLGGL